MKAKLKILYKNGAEDIIEQEASEEKLNETYLAIADSFINDGTGLLTFGNGGNSGYYVRLDQIARVQIVE